jgi:hypothetical protein
MHIGIIFSERMLFPASYQKSSSGQSPTPSFSPLRDAFSSHVGQMIYLEKEFSK